MHQHQTAFENIVGKGEIAYYEQFLLSPQCFLLNQIIISPFVHFFTSYLYLLLNWKSLKLAYEVKGSIESLFSVKYLKFITENQILNTIFKIQQITSEIIHGKMSKRLPRKFSEVKKLSSSACT